MRTFIKAVVWGAIAFLLIQVIARAIWSVYSTWLYMRK